MDFPRRNNKTPLRQTCLNGCVKVVKALLNKAGSQDRVNIVDSVRNWSCLHVAALMGHAQIVRMLLEKGAKPTKDKKGKTVLRLCCERWAVDMNGGHESVAAMVVDEDYAKDKKDKTPLFTAASVGSVKLTRKLLELGADRGVTDEHGWKPAMMARQNGHKEVARVLEAEPVGGESPSRLLVPDNQEAVTDEEESGIYAHNGGEEWICLVADHPVRSGDLQFYYEVEILKDADSPTVYPSVPVGLATKPGMTKGWVPGFGQTGGESYGYLGDEGVILANHDYRRNLEEQRAEYEGLAQCAYGQTIGCGLDVESKYIFWTVDGQKIDAKVPNASGRLFPVVGLVHASRIRVNFSGPFKYDPATRTE